MIHELVNDAAVNRKAKQGILMEPNVTKQRSRTNTLSRVRKGERLQNVEEVRNNSKKMK